MRWLLVLLMLLVAGRADAVCLLLGFSGLTTTQTFSSGALEYKPFENTTHAQTVSFKINGLVNVGTCQFFVAMRAGGSGNANARKMTLGAGSLNYQVYTDNSMAAPVLPVTSYSAANVLSGNFPQAVGVTQSANMSFTWTIPTEQVAKASSTRYSDTVAFDLYDGIPAIGLYLLKDTLNVTFQSKVESMVDLSLVGTGAGFNVNDTSEAVNFGTAATGTSRAFDVNIRSNDGYSVTMQSSNQQKLVKGGTPAANIPYSITVGGTSRNLSGGGAVAVSSGQGVTTALTGSSIPVNITLGTVATSQTAGTYQDAISVNVSAY